jgi:cytochrome c oxidase assembly protein subunit 15
MSSTAAQSLATTIGETGTRALRLWLAGLAALIVAMILVGGATRLTGSGLSITEWQPVTGTIPPLSEAAWEEAFAAYKRIPQYAELNRGMSLDEFKTIYWWEWTHRFLGRLIGVYFLVPFLACWLAGLFSRGSAHCFCSAVFRASLAGTW